MIGIRITNTLNDRNHSLVVERFERAHPRVEPGLGVDCQHRVSIDPQAWAHLIVAIVTVRYDAVQSIVAAVEVDQDQAAVVASRQTRQRRLRERPGEDVLGIRDHREPRDRPK